MLGTVPTTVRDSVSKSQGLASILWWPLSEPVAQVVRTSLAPAETMAEDVELESDTFPDVCCMLLPSLGCTSLRCSVMISGCTQDLENATVMTKRVPGFKWASNMASELLKQKPAESGQQYRMKAEAPNPTIAQFCKAADGNLQSHSC